MFDKKGKPFERMGRKAIGPKFQLEKGCLAAEIGYHFSFSNSR